MTLVKREANAFPSLFERLFNDQWALNGSVSDGAFTVPSVNIEENEKGYNLQMAVPGLKKEQIKIDLDHRLLTISASESNEHQESKGKFNRREFNYSSFKRSFTLPETVNVEKIDASYKEGILNISLPNKDEVLKANRQISIK